MSNLHFGVTVPQIKRPWVAADKAARAFESQGFDSVWVCDHLYGPQSPQLPILEAWTMIAALAAITERVELGTLVTPTGMRNPAHLGKMIASVDNIAGGRVIAGLGGGWMPREFTDFKFGVSIFSLFAISIIDPIIGSISKGFPAFKSCVVDGLCPVSYTHLRAHETRLDLV